MFRYAWIVLVSVLVSWSTCADTVELVPDPDSPSPDEGLKLEGKVIRKTDEYLFFRVGKDDGNEVRIPLNKIKKVEKDLDSELEGIPEDDYAKRYKVAVGAMEQAMYPEAIKLFEALKGKEGVGPDMLKLMGKAYENRQQLDKALEEYSDYLKLHPEDAEVAAKVKELTKVVKPEETKSADGEKIKSKNVDGLEGDGTWIAENWAITAKAQFSVDPNTGNRTVVVTTDGTKDDKDKVAISRIGQPLNLSESKEMIYRIFHNSDKAIPMAIAFQNSEGEWHESQQMRVPPNSWSNMSVKVDGKRFKATRNNFKDFDLEIAGRDNVKKIIFLFYTKSAFTLYLDSIFFK
ncbi:MAG TPA: tetratricopeptide repeat protein [Planctomycetota bacterium]|jgi:tetratricopeptide (TPR) repeat protein